MFPGQGGKESVKKKSCGEYYKMMEKRMKER